MSLRGIRPDLPLPLMVMLALVCLGACSRSSTVSLAPTRTASARPVSTPTAVPTAQVLTQIPFTCPVTVAGAVATFDDPAISLRFTFPATWTEHDCVDMGSAASGSHTLLIGNLFILNVAPRNGLTIQQWVAKVTDPTVEQVTLTPLSVPHAQDAASLTVTSVPNAPRPPTQMRYVVAGTQQFYDVTPLIAQMSMTDTIPQPYGQGILQVVSTFEVP